MVSTDEQNSDRARLLAEKQVLNKYLVENKDILINYNIFNVGSRFVEKLTFSIWLVSNIYDLLFTYSKLAQQ